MPHSRNLISRSLLWLVFLGLGYLVYLVMPLPDPPEQAYPVSWLSESDLLLVDEQAIYLRQAGTQSDIYRIPDDLADTVRFSGPGCWSETVWSIPVTRCSGSSCSGGGVFEFEVQGGAIISQRRYDPEFGEGLHPFDCTSFPIRGHDTTIAADEAGAVPLKATTHEGPISRRDVDAVRLATKSGRTVIEYDVGQDTHRMVLGPERARYGWEEVSRDRSAARYLFHADGRGYSNDPDRWPMTVWLADFDAHTVTELDLPIGPWVADHPERPRCFSCGCGCYRRANLHLVGSRIYAHVHGIGFPRSVRGLYVLDLADEVLGWQGLIEGVDLRAPVFSPSGCRLAYQADRIRDMNLCE